MAKLVASEKRQSITDRTINITLVVMGHETC